MRCWTRRNPRRCGCSCLTAFAAVRHRFSSSATKPPSALYTYTLTGGSSRHTLYVPLTSYCNSATLPQTRGPNFVLPAEAVAALCRVRDAELKQQKWDFWCRWLDKQEAPQKLPAPEETSFRATYGEENDLLPEPSVETLLVEIEQYLKVQHSQQDDSPQTDTTTIVIAGEGEPTLRLHSLTKLVQQLSELIPRYKDTRSMIRINTNGLLETASADQLLATCRTVVQKTEKVQIALGVPIMTHDPDQYEELMHPVLIHQRDDDDDDDNDDYNTPHQRVQHFVRACDENDLMVDVAAVERPGLVDKAKTEALAASLGVTKPVRWRKYFP